ncbi:MAG: TlyA family RNA methyltransferase [Oscillospiraceae bacterium]
MRLDVYLSEKNLTKSRAAAAALIKAGAVSVNGKIVEKSAFEVGENDDVQIVGETLKYVGRGGLKLEKALEIGKIDLNGKTCLDIGASTGGFTDCMLQNGAKIVYAVDVGTNQLDEKLRNDARVVSLENTDIRDFFLNSEVDFIGTDVSFISLKLVLPHIFRLLKSDGTAVVLIKPQFEAGTSSVGRKALSKKGVVTDEKARLKIVGEVKDFAVQCGFTVLLTEKSPITGGSGNVEYLMILRKALS